jgi:hypothetical protein
MEAGEPGGGSGGDEGVEGPRAELD